MGGRLRISQELGFFLIGFNRPKLVFSDAMEGLDRSASQIAQIANRRTHTKESSRSYHLAFAQLTVKVPIL
jgi:hypothetical protein